MRSPCGRPECITKSKVWCSSHCRLLKVYQIWLLGQGTSLLQAVDIESEYSIGE